MVHRNGLRLLRLVNTLLDFSRIEAGRVRATYPPDRPRRLYRGARQQFPLGLRARRTGTDRRLPVLAAAGVCRCRHVGTRGAEPGLQRIQVHARPAASRVTVRLADDADRGTRRRRYRRRHSRKHELPRIFDRFHRIEGQAARTMEGTGIGLALVSELVRLHGGTIDVQSKVGVGTTVRVALAARLCAPAGRAGLAGPGTHDAGRHRRGVVRGGGDALAAAVGSAARSGRRHPGNGVRAGRRCQDPAADRAERP